jgi:hypothetical protein
MFLPVAAEANNCSFKDGVAVHMLYCLSGVGAVCKAAAAAVEEEEDGGIAGWARGRAAGA